MSLVIYDFTFLSVSVWIVSLILTWIDFFLFFSSFDSHFGCVVVLIVIEFSIDDGDYGYESGDPGDCVSDFAGDYVSDFEYGYGDVAVI